MTVGEAITEWEGFHPEGTYAARADMQGLKEVAELRPTTEPENENPTRSAR